MGRVIYLISKPFIKTEDNISFKSKKKYAPLILTIFKSFQFSLRLQHYNSCSELPSVFNPRAPPWSVVPEEMEGKHTPEEVRQRFRDVVHSAWFFRCGRRMKRYIPNPEEKKKAQETIRAFKVRFLFLFY